MEHDSRLLLEALVVKAVLEGSGTRQAVVERLRSIDPREVEEAIDRLIAGGYLKEVEEGRIFKRRRLVLTRRGLERLAEAKRLLEAARSGRLTLDVDPALLALALSMILGAVILSEALDDGGGQAEASGGEHEEWDDFEEEMVDLDLSM